MRKCLIPFQLISLLTGCGSPSSQVIDSPGIEIPYASQKQIEYAFTQDHQHPEKLLKNVISASKSTLDIAIYSITQKDIVDTILAAQKRGVKVRIITDQREAKNKNQAGELRRLRAVGIPIKENSHPGVMQLKVTIADGSVVTTGSYNYSHVASTTNDEVLVVIHNASIAKDWEAQFNRMWDDTKNFTDSK